MQINPSELSCVCLVAFVPPSYKLHIAYDVIFMLLPYTLAMLLYPSLGLLVPGLSSHFYHYFLYSLLFFFFFFNDSSGQQYLWEMATGFCKLRAAAWSIGLEL